ncbi:uncharacterized protein LOC143295707 isoform X2 [Babylonia areolata]|uniref:uncharacterized protein LOC143295707 isoform X2 n=1 Tax=Babylonia areolata TaxID=304850 RepID=UPI003FD2B8BC
MMDYSYQHQYNMYPDYYAPSFAQQYPPYSMVNFLASSTSGTGTTPTLTPTTLVSLEQTFTELQSAAQGGAHGATAEHQTQSGFVPPVVDPSSREHSQDSFGSSDTEWEPAAKRGRGSYSSSYVTVEGSSSSSSSAAAPQRKYTRRSRHEKLSPEEERRRAVRRERNKVAAAKCRQRRVDHTNCLVEETEKLEAEQNDLENEIQSLKQQRDQLEFILQAHVPVCKVASQAPTFKIKTEPADFSLVTSACTSHLHSPPPTSSSSSSRPKSLALGGEVPVVVSCAGPGITLSTPSSGLFTYTSLDSLVDGSTGLTPLTAGPVSCSSQVHRSETEGGSEAVTSPTLISL